MNTCVDSKVDKSMDLNLFYNDFIPIICHSPHIYPKNRKKKVDITNQDFFDIIDTEQKAYWLGFLYADGSIGRYVLKIGLSKKDILHLQKFANIFNVKMCYRQNGKNVESYIQIYDKYLYNKLFELGMRNRDLNTIKNNIPEELIRHFIRGFFDGDGCISICNHSQKYKDKEYIYKRYNLSFACFSYMFANDLQDIICVRVKILKNKIIKHTNANCWYPSWGNIQDIKKFKDWIYNDSNIYLERKKEIFDTILLKPSTKSMWKRYLDNEITGGEYNDYKSQRKGYKDFNEYESKRNHKKNIKNHIINLCKNL